MNVEDSTDAFHVLTAPSAYSTNTVATLIDTGYEHWTTDGNRDPQKLTTAIDQFGEVALKKGADANISVSLPMTESVQALAALNSVGGLLALTHEVFSNTPRRNNRPYQLIQSFACDNAIALVQDHDDELIMDLAEYIFGKGEGDVGMHPGRVCTDVLRHTGIGAADAYLEIPLVAASNSCYKKTRSDDGTELHARINENALYVPIDRFYDELRAHLEDAFDTLVTLQQDTVPADQVEWLVQEASTIPDMIEKWDTNGHRDLLFDNWDPDASKRDLLTRAVDQAPEDVAELGQPLRASAIKDALDTYEPKDHERALVEEVQSPGSIGRFLQTQEDAHGVDISRGENFNLYELHRSGSGSAKPLHAQSLADLAKLPCFSKMFKEFEEDGPTHEDLLNFAGTAKWLEHYQIQNGDGKFVDDMNEFFSQFSWYDPAITSYQADYELGRTDDAGDPYNPKACGHDDMQKWCPGEENCPYSIYGSLPLSQDLYDNMDS